MTVSENCGLTDSESCELTGSESCENCELTESE